MEKESYLDVVKEKVVVGVDKNEVVVFFDQLLNVEVLLDKENSVILVDYFEDNFWIEEENRNFIRNNSIDLEQLTNVEVVRINHSIGNNSFYNSINVCYYVNYKKSRVWGGKIIRLLD